MLFAESEGGPFWAFVSLMVACWFFSRAVKLWRNPNALKEEQEARAKKRKEIAASVAGSFLKAFLSNRR